MQNFLKFFKIFKKAVNKILVGIAGGLKQFSLILLKIILRLNRFLIITLSK